MKKSKFTDSQIAFVPRQAEARGEAAEEVGVSCFRQQVRQWQSVTGHRVLVRSGGGLNSTLAARSDGRPTPKPRSKPEFPPPTRTLPLVTRQCLWQGSPC